MFDILKSQKKQKKREIKNKVDENTVNDIKEFFFSCHGDGMSMWKADEKKYEKYRMIDADAVEDWRQELINKNFELLSDESTKKHSDIVGDLIRLISRSKLHIESNFKKLLEKLNEIAPVLDQNQRIIILEDFAGRTSSQEDGGIFEIKTKASLNRELSETLSLLADFSYDESKNANEKNWIDMQERLDNVKINIQKAYSKFGV